MIVVLAFLMVIMCLFMALLAYNPVIVMFPERWFELLWTVIKDIYAEWYYWTIGDN
jgi:hypothetical protein